MEMGKTRLQAALDGSREIGFTIISMTLSLAAVFIPVLFMGGLVGRLFREFAVTIGTAVLVSGFISLTLTPMLGSRFLKPPAEVHHGHIYAVSERVFQGMIRLYDWTLRGVLRHRLGTILVSLAVLGGTVWLFMLVPKGFIPSEDRGQIMVSTEAAEDISYPSMFEHQQALATVIQQDPNVDSFMSSAGGGGFGGSNTGNLFLRLKPRSERKLTADEVVQELRPKTAQVPGIRTFLQNPPVISVGGRMSRSQYQFTLQGPDTDELYAAAGQLETRMRELPDFLDVTSDLRISNPKVTVQIERDKAQSYGVTAAQIETTLYDAYGSRQVSTILSPNNEYQVILEADPQCQLSPRDLALLYIRSSKGQLVPLSAVAHLSDSVGPLSINHSGQLPSVTVSFNLRPGVSLGEALERVKALARDLPATVSTSFQGTAHEFQSSLAGMGLLLVLAVLVIYMVLGILYESFIHPLTILTALPFAGFGALATLMLFKVELSLYAFVGIIMLIGLVKKNGIMMIDFALQAQRTEGLLPREAIHQACLIRFRPIMMTTMAALMAGLPIALGYGAGGESRRPLGLAVVGGLVFSQTLTLYVTPVFYTYMESLQKFLRTTLGRRRHAQPSPVTAE
jgi:HAE1 family hydrophobic/amphiphilic exporter-1